MNEDEQAVLAEWIDAVIDHVDPECKRLCEMDRRFFALTLDTIGYEVGSLDEATKRVMAAYIIYQESAGIDMQEVKDEWM